jgi:predicted phosphodiesterase
MEPVSIAVASDLHAGNKTRAKELCSSKEVNNLDEGYLSHFERLVESESLKASCLIVPGDLTEQADSKEFELASEAILKIACALKVPEKSVFFVPGNHDVDRKVMEANGQKELRRTQRYDALAQSGPLLSGIRERGEVNFLEEPYLTYWRSEDETVFIVGCNSSWDDNPEKAVHFGSVHKNTFPAIHDILASPVTHEDTLRIFLVHHHPIQYSNPIEGKPDFSIMPQSQTLLRMLRDYHFDLLIHGHKHVPCFETYVIESGFPLSILCSGSFSIRLPSLYNGLVSNQFHIINIYGRDDESQTIYGDVLSWTFLSGHGWLPSKSHNGIRHRIPFGAHVQEKVLKRDLTRILGKQLSESPGYVEWEALFTEMPHLEYLSNELAERVLDSLETTVGFRRHGDLPDDVILLARRTN